MTVGLPHFRHPHARPRWHISTDLHESATRAPSGPMAPAGVSPMTSGDRQRILDRNQELAGASLITEDDFTSIVAAVEQVASSTRTSSSLHYVFS
jgi:hypothetical protein